MVQPVLSSVPLVRVRFIRTASNKAIASQTLKASPTVRSLTVNGQHGFIDPLEDVVSETDPDTGVGYFDLVATDDPDVAEAFGWDITFDGSTRPLRRVQVPQTGSIVEMVTDSATGQQMPAVWLNQLADFTGASGPVGSDVATMTFVEDAIRQLQTTPDPFAQYMLDSDGDRRYQPVITLANAKGDGTTVDTAAINSVLAAAPARSVVRGLPGKTYLIDAPIRLRPGGQQTLDMTGCSVVLKAGSNCNMLQNYAVGAVRRVLDAVTTAGSTTVTSATAAFTTADVGKRVRIEHAAGGAVHDTTIASVTNATTAVLAAAPTSAVTGEYMAIGARESDIHIIGGHWDRQNNGSTPVQDTFDAHSLRLRHVDGLVIRDLVHAGTYGKYAVNPGDCRRVRTEDITFVSSSSDGVHFNGPCSQVVVRNILGVALGDDIVSFTARDTFTIITDTAGDITDVAIDTVSYRTPLLATSSVLKLVAGQTTDFSANYRCANIKARNLTGPCTQGVVCVGDNVPVGGNGGVFEDIDIESVKSITAGPGTQPVVRLRVGLMDRITLRDITAKPTDAAVVSVSATVGTLLLSDIHWFPSVAGNSCVLMNGGTVATLITEKIVGALAAACALLRMEAGSAITKWIADNISLNCPGGGANLINMITLPLTLAQVQLSNLNLAGVAAPLGDYRTTTVVSAQGVVATGMSGWVRARDTASPAGAAAVTLVGCSGLYGDVDYVAPADTNSTLVVRAQSSVLQAGPDALTSGEEAYPRALTNPGNAPLLSSGVLWLTYFTARKTESVPNVRTATTTQAAATPTLCRIGIYSVAKNGDLTLLASLPNDTTLWSATNSRYNKALSTAFAKVAGQRYAIGLLYVGTTAPLVAGTNLPNGTEAATAPRLTGSVSGLSDLPASITASSINDSTKYPYAAVA